MDKILIVDNNEGLREALRNLLSDLGFIIYACEDAKAAQALLEKTWVHLVIIDVRLNNDSDPNDISGIDFSRCIDPSVYKLLFSGYDSFEALRQALKPDQNGDVNAFYFAKKEEGPEKLLEIIKIIFKKKININYSLKIIPKDILNDGDFFDYRRALEELYPGINYTKGGQEYKDAQEEIEEIIRRLFCKSKKIQIKPLTGGLSGAGVVRVSPEYESGLSNDIILKFGLRKYIQEEEINIKNYVTQFIGAKHTTFVLDSAHTAKFQGTAYAFIGSSSEDIYSFEDYYKMQTNNRILKAIDNLFNQTCKYWYDNKTNPSLNNIKKVYEEDLCLTKKKLISIYRYNFNNSSYRRRIMIPTKFEDLVNEIWGYDESKFVINDYSSCITHGDLNGKNILVDEIGNAWLIDFRRTKMSFSLRDFIRLESTIKFELTNFRRTNFRRFENLLTKYDSFSDFEINDITHYIKDDEVKKSLDVIKKIRHWAHEKTTVNEMKGYYLGLLFQNLKFLTWESSWNQESRIKHILDSVSVIKEKIK